MIKPLPEYDIATNDFVVCDIENLPDGTVIDIDTAWRNEAGEIEHILHGTWAEWWGWIKTKARNDHRFRVVHAHNGGGWDWLSLAEYLLHAGKTERQHLTAICAGSKMVTMSVQIEKKFTIHLCDSLQLLRSGIDKLAKTLLGTGKVDTDGKLPHEVKAENIELYYEYLKNDTEMLLKVLEKSVDILRKKVAKVDGFSYTIGSTAMKVFRTIGIEEPITIPWDDTLKDFLREGYRGGRVENFKRGKFEHIKVYDINSLYPSVMRSVKVPISDRGYWTSEYEPGKVGLYRGNFIQKRRDIHPILMEGGKGTYKLSGVYFTPELELLKELDPDSEFHIETGYVFIDTSIVFRKYVDSLYALRLQDKDGPVSLLCKYLLNSLYGKFGQNAIREKIVSVNSFDELYDLVESGATCRPINDDLGVYGLEQETVCGFEHVGIAGMITSAARASLYKGIYHAGKSVVYCDTDSVHTISHFPDSMVSDKIGEWKLEFEGEGVYIGKKLYGLRDKKGIEKIRAKGISIGGRNGHHLDFDSLVSLCNPEKAIECHFSQPATPLQVFNGKKSCMFMKKKRTIRMV